ncbi:DUF2163 domain-containing protein [Magnetococcales bacterium HHB-1]
MKSISTALTDHIQQDVTTLANCWCISRKDGTTLRFTDHDVDLVVGGETFAAQTGFSASAISGNTDMSVGNLDVEAVVDDESITEVDILSGLYDGAAVEIFKVNWASPDAGTIPLKSGTIAEIELKGKVFVAELRGKLDRLNTNFMEVYSPTCRITFCSPECKLDANIFSQSSNVTGVTDQRQFSTNLGEASGFFNGGMITWTDGSNAGRKMEIKTHSNGQISLALPMAYTIQAGDSFTAIRGCDKRFETCCNTFNNAINFRGEPEIPGMEKSMLPMRS